MSRIDLHPEELFDRESKGTLTDREAHLLEEHRQHCSACALEDLLRADFAEELLPEDADDVALDNVLDRFVPASRKQRARSPLSTAWLVAGFASILVFAGSAAALWTYSVASYVGESFIDIEQNSEQPPVKIKQRSQRPRRTDGNKNAVQRQTPEESPELETQPQSSATNQPNRGKAAKQVSLRRPPLQPSTQQRQTEEPSLTAGEIFAQANSARRQRRYAEAARIYQDLGQRFPGSREEVASRVSLGRLMLDRLHNPRGALRLFDSYLSTVPQGTLAIEAHVGRAMALQRLGRRTQEIQAWQRIIDGYPDSIHAQRAHQKLRELRTHQ